MAEKPVKKQKSTLRSWIETGLVILAILAFRSSFFEPFRIPSGSMIPTLYVGDFILVQKFAYGFHLPFLTDRIIDREGPKRGDIIVFKYPLDESINYIKRVIGLPGDRIELKAKRVFINDTPLEWTDASVDELRKEIKSLNHPLYSEGQVHLHRERIGTHNATIFQFEGPQTGDDFGPITVPEGHYFAMGDNRNQSNDSRYWGFIPRQNILGRALFTWFSAWISFSDSDLNGFRPERIGRSLTN